MALRIAFATTTQALSLSIVLMFTKYLVGQAENNLLAKVDRRVDDELLGRFELGANEPDGQLAAVRRMAEATRCSLTKNCSSTRSSFGKAQSRNRSAAGHKRPHRPAKRYKSALSGALEGELTFTRRTARASRARTNGKQPTGTGIEVQQALAEDAKATAALQASVSDQVKILYRTVEATGQIARLEETLNRNLSALAGSKNFEQTVMSLAAAIHLLNARFGQRCGRLRKTRSGQRIDTSGLKTRKSHETSGKIQYEAATRRQWRFAFSILGRADLHNGRFDSLADNLHPSSPATSRPGSGP